jgi:eukaryotic-like serine/threonine-protein kinase
MALTSGNCVGPYEILSAIGAGGMGEVYRAHDSKLGRDVALKVLPEAFARDAERMARFQREAKVLASLNHPNIASIYGLEDSGATHALVMELVEGPTLADRIKSGPIPIDEALRIAKQICEALEYAHERGIVHRDLKPANVKVTNDDAVKVLDFGLAKALESDASSIDISTSPTISRMATQAGVLLGTAAYMSPEQAKGKPVDRRADIWAFGCVLYEMLTGKMAFTGETVTDILAAVVRAEPEWTLLPAGTPLRVRVLLQRCLQKDSKQRLRDIGDARIAIDEALSGAPLEAPTPGELYGSGWPGQLWRRGLPWAAGALAVALASLATWNLKPSPARPVMRAVLALPAGQRLAGLDGQALAFSADGNEVAYVATTQGSASPQIYLRSMDSANARPIPGTDGATNPFYSPDGQWLGFFANRKLKKVPVSGGPAQDLADVEIPLGASWSGQGMIAFSNFFAGFLQVPDAGGTPQTLTRFEKGDISQGWPEFLPGDKAVLFAASPDTADWTNSQIGVELLGGGERTNLLRGTTPRYARPGYLIFAQAGNLMAVPFDPGRLEIKGAAVPVVQGVLESRATGTAQYSFSAAGSLVYVSGGLQGDRSELVWVTRNGTEQVLPVPARAYFNPRLSPDGRRVAVNITEQESQIWLYDLTRDTLTRFTFDGTSNQYPTWTPDGKRIAFRSNKQEGTRGIFWKFSDGSGDVERLSIGDTMQTPNSWSPNGQTLAFMAPGPTRGQDIWMLRMSDHKEQPFVETGVVTGAPEFSPDGHWLVYVSDESGRREVYVRSYPGPGGKWQISSGGGTEPVWNRNGRELFYRSGDNMLAVEISTQPAFAAGKPRMLFQAPYLSSPVTFPNYDVSPDGQRFLMLKPVEQAQAAPTQINVVLNWFEELKRLVPTGSK